MVDDYFDSTLALNPAGGTVPNAVATVYALDDITFTTPLEITNMSGVIIDSIVASPDGIYPAFKVTSGERKVNAKSGEYITPITSMEGMRGEPGAPGEPGVGLPPAGSLPDGYMPVVAAGVWSAAPAPSGGGGGGGSGSILEVYWVAGSGWPALGSTPIPGVKSRWFLGGPTPYTGVTWPGVLDFYVAAGV